MRNEPRGFSVAGGRWYATSVTLGAKGAFFRVLHRRGLAGFGGVSYKLSRWSVFYGELRVSLISCCYASSWHSCCCFAAYVPLTASLRGLFVLGFRYFCVRQCCVESVRKTVGDCFESCIKDGFRSLRCWLVHRKFRAN